MARGRMLDRAFTKSKKLNGIARDHRLVYASILPFLDRAGRIVAEPIVLKANVFRRTDFTAEEIGQAVRTLADVGLIRLYADEDNDAILQFEGFSEFNNPNAKEAKSDLPGPDDEGVVPCRDPLIIDAPATHAQRTGNAGGERNVNGTLTVNENVNVNPPYPPTPTEPPTIDEAEEAKEREASRQARRHDHRVLQAHHPDVWRALGELTSTYDWKAPQHRKVAERLLELTRDHGGGKVVAAIDKVLLNAGQVKWPIAFVEKVLTQDAASQATGAASPLTSDEELDRIFGVA
jgi:hypothetical protein